MIATKMFETVLQQSCQSSSVASFQQSLKVFINIQSFLI